MSSASELKRILYGLESAAIDKGLEESAYAYGGAAELFGCYELEVSSLAARHKYVQALETNGKFADSNEEKEAWTHAATIAREQLEL